MGSSGGMDLFGGGDADAYDDEQPCSSSSLNLLPRAGEEDQPGPSTASAPTAAASSFARPLKPNFRPIPFERASTNLGQPQRRQWQQQEGQQLLGGGKQVVLVGGEEKPLHPDINEVDFVDVESWTPPEGQQQQQPKETKKKEKKERKVLI